MRIPPLRLDWEKSGSSAEYPPLRAARNHRQNPPSSTQTASKPTEEDFCHSRSIAALVPPALLPGPSCSLCPRTSLPPAKARPRHLHLKNLLSAGACSSLLLLYGSTGKVFPCGLIRAAPSRLFFKRSLLISTRSHHPAELHPGVLPPFQRHQLRRGPGSSRWERMGCLRQGCLQEAGLETQLPALTWGSGQLGGVSPPEKPKRSCAMSFPLRTLRPTLAS